VDRKILNLCRKERSTRGETNLARKAFRPPKQEETKKNKCFTRKDGAPRTFKV
jgi:hypothetical protein